MTSFVSKTTLGVSNSVLIHEAFQQGITRSFEYFPPKTEEEAAALTQTISELHAVAPSFVSVTYHRGSPESRQRTYDLVCAIEAQGTAAMAHVICVGHRRSDMEAILGSYLAAGVQNLMALGGDPSNDPDSDASDFTYAIELVELARDMGTFSIGVGAHPDGHPRSSSLAEDRRRLAEKLTAADFAVTQFFFETSQWTNLVADLGALDVTKPVLPGIMPVTTMTGISRMAQMGAAVPLALVARLEAAHAAGGPSAVRAAGIAAATELCEELLDAGAPGIHFYTLNRSTATREIYDALFDDDGYRRTGVTA
jgi:methylenetetrahydrofolate reductase (NADPH)